MTSLGTGAMFCSWMNDSGFGDRTAGDVRAEQTAADGVRVSFVIATSPVGVHSHRMKSHPEPATNVADAAAQPKPRYTPKPKGSWMKLFGRARNDDLSPEAYRLGAEWRERMNREGR